MTHRTTRYCKAKRVQNKDFQPENHAKGVAFGRIQKKVSEKENGGSGSESKKASQVV